MSGGFGATSGRGVVVPFGVSVAIFVIFGTTPIVCNAIEVPPVDFGGRGTEIGPNY